MRKMMRMISEMGRAIRYELLSTFGTFLTVFLAMTLPGILWVVADNLTRAEHELKSGLTMDVFLSGEPSPEKVQELRDRLLALDGIVGARYVSSQDALFKMRETFGLEMIKDLDENPLPASIVLDVDESLYEPSAAKKTIEEISTYPEVEDVIFAVDLLNRLKDVLRSIKLLGLAMAILVAFSAVFIVANTVRVAISDRRKAVEIMQLVGATRTYILAPFVFLGGILGILGAGFSMLFLWASARFVSRYLLQVGFLGIFDVLAFVLIGLLLGMVGALVATRKHLTI